MFKKFFKEKRNGRFVFLCNSPLQVLNAYEARSQLLLDSKKCVLVIVPLSENLKSLLEVSKLEPWARVVVTKTRLATSVRKKLSFFGFLRRRHKHIKEWQGRLQGFRYCKRVFLAHTGLEETRMMASWLSPRKVTYIDDGTLTAATIDVLGRRGGTLTFGRPVFGLRERLRRIKDRKNLSFYSSFWKRGEEVVKWLKYRVENKFLGIQGALLGVKSGRRFSFDIFSVYAPRDGGRFILNRRNYMRSKLGQKVHDKNLVHFLGAPFVERKLVAEDAYIKWIQSVKKYFHGRKVVYVLHPAESEKFAQIIRQKAGVECVRYDLPYEVVFAVSDLAPSVIASWFCSALENINDFGSEDVELVAFRVGVLGVGMNNVHRAALDFYSRHESGSRITLAPI